MNHTVIWKYQNGPVTHRLVGHPETYDGVDTAEKARKEGGVLLEDDLDEEFQGKLRPLAIVEINHHMIQEISECEQIELGELNFCVIDDLNFWRHHGWWAF